MVRGGIGGANTQTGLVFEGKTDLATFLQEYEGYTVVDGNVFFNGKKIARIFKKYAFYKFLDELGINWKACVSNDDKNTVIRK